MNKRSRKTRGLPLRLAALLLCCVCLVSVVSVSAIALEADASPATEETTVPTEAETTAPEETTQPTDPDAEIMPVAETEETAETTVPVETAAEQEPAKSAADVLYERLMACTTYAEMEAAVNGLTEEEQLLMNQFTAEQNAALEAKMKELGGYAVGTLENRGPYFIAQGETKNISVSNISSSSKFSYSCEPKADITAFVYSGLFSSGYTISVGSSVPAGTYTLTVNYETTSWGLGSDTTSNTDTVTVTVTRSGNYLTVINNMTNVDVAYVKIENNAVKEEPAPVTSGSAMEITLPSSSEAIAFFVKPKAGYLLTSFYRVEGGDVDLYSVDTNAASCNFQYFKNNPTTGDAILTKAKNAGYLGYYGFTGQLTASSTWTFVEVAEAPQMSISAIARPDKDLKPGDKVTFTVTVTPGNLSTGANYSITNKTITSLTINGVSYPATQNEDGTYSVDYEITEDDWVAKKATLDVTASLTYNYVVPVTDRNDLSGNIRTEATISSSATTDCTFATKQGVLYTLSYDAPAGVNPPLDSSLADYIPVAPVDNKEYFEKDNVTVKPYDRSDVDDPANKGTWTFTGWKHDGLENLQEGDTVKMEGNGLLFTGVWKFTPYLTYDLTIKKTLSGNMYNENDKFTFTVEHGTNPAEVFELGKDGTKTITVRVGDKVTITETQNSYHFTVDSVDPDTLVREVSGSSVSFTMPNSNVSVVINNDKTVTVDTGVLLDSLPYVLILALVAAGAVLFVRKRRNRDDD